MRKTETSATNVLAVVICLLNDGEGRTIHYREHASDNFGGPPSLEYTELVLIERKVREC